MSNKLIHDLLRKIIIAIITINLVLFGAVSMAKKNGEYGTFSKNANNRSPNLQIKNFIESAVNYYVRSSEDLTCSAEDKLASGTLAAASSSDDPSITEVDKGNVDNKGRVNFCTTCDEYLVSNNIKYGADEPKTMSTGLSSSDLSSSSDEGYKHMKIYCTNGEECSYWGDDSYVDVDECD